MKYLEEECDNLQCVNNNLTEKIEGLTNKCQEN